MLGNRRLLLNYHLLVHLIVPVRLLSLVLIFQEEVRAVVFLPTIVLAFAL
jgi:hypothetical protein